MQLLTLFAPVIMGIATILGTGIYVGDAMPISYVLQRHNSDAFVLFSIRSEDIYSFKMLSTLARQPRVLGIGSSRVLGFRSMFFNKDSSNFYNAGMVTAEPNINIQSMKDLAELGFKPEIVLWALDHHWFAENWQRWFPEFRFDLHITETRLIEGTQRVFRPIGLKNFEVFDRTEPIHNRFAMGIEAILNGIGYRNDGSIQWTNQPGQENLFGRDQILFDERAEHFIAGNHISQERLAEFEDGLRWMLDQGMQVVFYLPPYAPHFYNQMIESGEYGYLQELSAALQELSAQHDAPFYDFTDAQILGATDNDMADGWHASERLTLQMYMIMLEDHPEIFGEFSDPDFLRQEFEQADNQYDVFGTRF